MEMFIALIVSSCVVSRVSSIVQAMSTMNEKDVKLLNIEWKYSVDLNFYRGSMWDAKDEGIRHVNRANQDNLNLNFISRE